MRIRFKPWARPELEASKFYIDNPEEYKGKWKEAFKEPSNELHLELGCGKGSFISQLAVKNHNINYLAIDLVDAMLGLAKRNIEQKYNENKKEIDNIIITRYDIERILGFLRLGKNTKVSGKNGYDKLQRLYKQANKVYYKGIQSNGMIERLNIEKIANAVKEQLNPLYKALGVEKIK